MIWRIIAAFTVVFCASVLAVWVADRSPPVTIRRMELLTPRVTVGGELRIGFDIEHRGSCPLHVEHYLIDSAGVRAILPDLDFATIPDEDMHAEKYTVPLDFAPGRACYRRTSSYTCNPIQRWFAPIVIDRPAVCFEVVPKP